MPNVFPVRNFFITSGMERLYFFPSQCPIPQNTLYSSFLNITLGLEVIW